MQTPPIDAEITSKSDTERALGEALSAADAAEFAAGMSADRLLSEAALSQVRHFIPESLSAARRQRLAAFVPGSVSMKRPARSAAPESAPFVHAWSAVAAEAYIRRCGLPRRMLIELDYEDEWAALTPLLESDAAVHRVRFIVPDGTVASLLRRHGAVPLSWLVIPLAAAPQAARAPYTAELAAGPALPRAIDPVRVAARAALGLADDQPLLALLPPISSAAGLKAALWAALVVQHLFPRLRVVLGERNTWSDRLIRLARVSRQEFMLLEPPAELDLAAILTAADAGLFLADRPRSVQAVQLAQQLGLPLVLSDRRELRAACDPAATTDVNIWIDGAASHAAAIALRHWLARDRSHAAAHARPWPPARPWRAFVNGYARAYAWLLADGSVAAPRGAAMD